MKKEELYEKFLQEAHKGLGPESGEEESSADAPENVKEGSNPTSNPDLAEFT